MSPLPRSIAHYSPRMPARNRKSRDAKKKREEGRTSFTKHAVRPLSPNASDYIPSDDPADESPSDADSSAGRGEDDQLRTSVVALQRLYSVFLPPHLRINQDTGDNLKRRKIKNRPPIYTGDSRTTAWRKEVAQRKAEQGCGTLDGFIKRKVSKPTVPQSKASHCQ